jgi:hypothetical protein
MKRIALLTAAAALSVIAGAAAIPASAATARPGTAAQASTAVHAASAYQPQRPSALAASFPCKRAAGLASFYYSGCTYYGAILCPPGHVGAVSGTKYEWNGCPYRTWLYQNPPASGDSSGPGYGYTLCISPGTGNSGAFKKNYAWAWQSSNSASC